MNISTVSASSHTPRFGGVYANFNVDNMHQYLNAFAKTPAQHQLYPSATRIFRELPTTLAIAKLIPSTSQTQIHVLGCSDGSEVYAYAIAAKEAGKSKNVSVKGLDYAPHLVALAKTGYLVCTDQEKIWANDSKRAPNNPLSGSGWDTYLIKKTQPPNNFKALCTKYPILQQAIVDPVSNIKIGTGMHWYQVQSHDLPVIQFEHGKMQDYVHKRASKCAQVYVLANSLAYRALQEGAVAFVRVLQDLRNNNLNNNNVYTVFGDVEHQVLRQIPAIVGYMKALGYEAVSESELKQHGIKNVDKVVGNIWKVTASTPINLLH